MRILLSALCCSPRYGSESLVAYKYAEILADRHAVSVLAAPPSETPAGAELVTVPARAANLNDVSPADLMRFELRQIPRAWRLNRSNRFDVIHRATPSAISNATFLPVLRVPLVVGPLLAADRPAESFNEYLQRPASGALRSRFHPRRIMEALMRRVMVGAARGSLHLRYARRILVGTQIAADHVPNRYRDRCEPITYSGIEHDFFIPPPARSTGGPLRLLYVGRLEPYKGPELLLRSTAAAARRCDLKLRIVGSGDPAYGRFCRELAKELRLSDCVEFLESVPREELPRFYQEADVFCFPSMCDTYGVALLEAMSCQCAAVVGDAAGPREIVVDGTGLRVPMQTPNQFIDDYSQAIVALAGDAALRGELGRRARQRIVAHHDWDRIGRRLLEIYENL